MIPCKIRMYTLISMYLWGGFVYSQCFFPDGSPTGDLEEDYYPCNSTIGGQASSCCQLSTSTCTTGGYCEGNNGYAYRGACTDPNFPSPCPHYCLDVSTNLFSTIFPCGSEGGDTDSHCCGIMSPAILGSTADCCNQTITGIKFGNPFVPLSYVEAHATASSPTTSSSLASTTTIGNASSTSTPSASPATPSPITQSSSTSSSHAAAIGAGVGVPLGVALLLGLGFLTYREHKHRLKLESLLGDNLPRGNHSNVSQASAMDGIPHELGGYYRHELGGNYRHELGSNHRHELYSKSIHEAN